MNLIALKRSFWLLLLGLTACSGLSNFGKDFRTIFFEGRLCREVKFKCLNQVEDNKVKLPSEPYVLTEKDYARIERHKTLRMYREISQMLEIYYPGFWEGVTDEKEKLAWIEKAHVLAKKYYSGILSRGEISMMAHICSIIGLDFETNPKFQFIVNKLKNNEYGATNASSDIINYLRFEILQKDYSVGGVHYNTWSLRGVQEGMPPIKRYIPDFYTEAKPQNHNENFYKIYEDNVLNKVKK